MYNKNNLTNIYEYDPELISRINKKVKEYKSYVGYSYHYESLINDINTMFEYFNKDKEELKHFINHLANDRIYTDQSLNKIKEYFYYLYKTSNEGNYNHLLYFIKDKENGKDLKEQYEREMFSYDIWNRTALKDDLIYDLTADPYDGTAETLLDQLNNDIKSDWVQIRNRYRDNIWVEYKNEEEVLKKLYKLEYKSFNREFFNNLDLLEMERVNYREIEEEQEMEM